MNLKGMGVLFSFLEKKQHPHAPQAQQKVLDCSDSKPGENGR
jgi:hypothetical protein